jgi:hypothetical protein
MKVVIPLAGPDFERPDGTVKSQHLVDGEPLLEATLQRRPWWRSGLVTDADLTFVLKDSPRIRAYVDTDLRVQYPRARQIFLSTHTGGAALSALAGVAMVADAQVPLCIDLVDIAYTSTFDPITAFSEPRAGAVALVFRSSNPLYSYLRTDENGRVIEAAEKRVISEHASAGTYVFASAAIYIDAVAHNLRNRSQVTYNDLFFVCPVYNGVIGAGADVLLEAVTQVRDIKVG